MKLVRFARRCAGAVLARIRFLRDFRRFKALSGASAPGTRFSVRRQDQMPCLGDKTARTAFDRHYIYHAAWAARIIAQTRPAEHTDISSLLHFCTIVSAFVPVRFYDYRPADLQLSDLTSQHADLTALPFASGSISSLSCMHTVEHIGLGRYGDPLDPGGDLKAIGELKRVLAPGGSLLFVVPVGRPKVMFNGHRIYSYAQIVSAFSELELAQFALIPDNPALGGLLEDAAPELVEAQSYGCGCFWLRKPGLHP